MNEPEIRSLQGQYAGFVSRWIAFVVDLAIIITIEVVVAWATVSGLMYSGLDIRNCELLESRPIQQGLCYAIRWSGLVAGSIFAYAYTLFFWTVTGQTPGKALLGLRIVRLDGRPMGLMTSLVRLAGYHLSTIPMGLGYFAVLGDDKRQGWHDKIARTCVIYSWEARQNSRLIERVRRLLRSPRKRRRSSES
jgi:uncharacterized RDD family membrane protein YckC